MKHDEVCSRRYKELIGEFEHDDDQMEKFKIKAVFCFMGKK